MARPGPFKKILANCSCGWTCRVSSLQDAQRALAGHHPLRADVPCGPLIVVVTDGSLDEAFRRAMEEMGLKEGHE
jgi:hypothetical protein